MRITDYTQLELLFKRSTSLPPLPSSALKLIKAIDSGEASAIEIERIINGDPALASNVLRVTSNDGRVASTRLAIMRMGQKTVRSLAVSMAVQALYSSPSEGGFDAHLFSRHSAFTGFLARYLVVRGKQLGTIEVTAAPDEVFAAGLLHDLGIALLAKVAPEAYLHVAATAQASEVSLEEAFFDLYDKPLVSLAAVAASTWGLPSVFCTVFEHLSDPVGAGPERGLVACVAIASDYANQAAMRCEPWDYVSTPSDVLVAELGIPDDELTNAVGLVTEQTTAFVPETKKAA